MPTPELPHKRQATDRGKAEAVGQYFQRDVELLGYRFDPE